MFEAAYELVSEFEVLIIGAGLAGMMAAASLARAGIRVLLCDAQESYPKSFKAEKLGNDHAAHLRRLGMLEAVLQAATPVRELLEAYHGTRIAYKPVEHYGIHYHDFINALRPHLPSSVSLHYARVRHVETSPDRQRVTFEDGRTVDARLIVLASGRSQDLFRQLGLRKQTVSPMHSLSFGFTVSREDDDAFDFDELTYWGDRGSSEMPYVTFFRIGNSMRANAFAYWDQGDERTRSFLEDPAGELDRIMPGLARVTGPFRAFDKVECCPLHLHRIEGHLQPGLVVVGDAYRTVCPAAGTGVVKVLNDVECLTNDHVPGWLATPGMGLEKIANYYSSRKKTKYDADTVNMSLRMRKTGVDPGLRWRVRRAARTLKRSANALRARWTQPIPSAPVRSLTYSAGR